MRALGVRFGAYHIYVPALLKPAPSALLATLWALKNGGVDQPGLSDLAGLAASGRTSLPVDNAIPAPLYRIVGYSIAGSRAVRIDILERLADLIRPLIAWRATSEGAAPEGAAPGNGFTVTVAMTSLLGCSGEDFSSVLRALGYRLERRPAPATLVPETATGVLGGGAAEAAATPEASEEISADFAGLVPESQGDPATEEAEADRQQVEATDEAEHAEPANEAAADGATSDGTIETVEATTSPDIAAAEGTPPSEGIGAPVDAVDSGTVPTADDTTAAAEPVFVEIWRPGRRDRPKSRGDRPPATARPPRQGRGANEPTTGEPADKRPRSNKPRKRNFDGARQPPARSTPADRRRADPNSPFAALAALKAQLEGKEGKGEGG
jgi:ATP-dependent RNA helicase SUPV3L1/SUV3